MVVQPEGAPVGQMTIVEPQTASATQRPSEESGSRVLVTGGSGVVGRPIVARLAAQGREVVALTRSPASALVLERLGARTAAGDVRDEVSLASAMQDCDVVYHVAGENAFCLGDPSVLYQVNVEGSRNVIRAAAHTGVSRVVYTSSATVVGEPQGETGHEDSAHRGWFLSHYERSKTEAEEAVRKEAAAHDIEVVYVNPSSVQGPGRAGGTTRILRWYLEGKLRVFVDSSLSLIDIDDCAEGHLLAEQRGRPGERYILNGATLSTREALRIVTAISGIRQRARLLPAPAALGAAWLVEHAARLRKRTPPVCTEMVRTLLHGHRYDGARAARELGLAYRPIEETLRRTVEWLVREGKVSRPLPGLDP